MGLYFEEFKVGEVFKTKSRTVTEADIVMFSGLSGDYNALHTNEEYAKKTEHGTRIAHGMLVLSIATGLMYPLGITDETGIGFLGINEFKFLKSVKANDTIRVELKISEKRESKSRNDAGIIMREISILNQKDELVQRGIFAILMKKKSTTCNIN